MSKIFQLITSIHLGGYEIVAFDLAGLCKIDYPNDLEFVLVELFQTRDLYSYEKKKELVLKNIRSICLCKFSILAYYFITATSFSKQSNDAMQASFIPRSIKWMV